MEKMRRKGGATVRRKLEITPEGFPA